MVSPEANAQPERPTGGVIQQEVASIEELMTILYV